MKKYSLILLVLFLLALSFLAGYWVNHKSADPGIATDSGMKLEPVYEDGAEGDTGEADVSSMPPGTVSISPQKQQLIGVRVAIVEKASQSYNLRTLGRVAPDEKRVYRLVAGTDGWIRETYNNDTGTLVKKGERLASFYSPLFRTTQYNYLSVLGSSPDNRFDAGRRQVLAPSQLATLDIKTYIDALESLGMSEQQIKELASTRQVTDNVFIVAPATGFIIARNVSPGQQFEKGFEWYRIADLSRVWILTDTFENEAQYLKSGTTVKVSLPNQTKTFQAKVSNVLPEFDPITRTLKVRLEAENPGYVLRPDMFVDVELPVKIPPAIMLPADAIIFSGTKKTVFINKGDGYFEPRQVQTGRRLGNKVEITKGLSEGERVVISGNFLIDSESKLRGDGLGTFEQPPSADDSVHDSR